MTWIWILLAILVIAIGVTAALLCLPYWRSPEKLWREDVLSAYRAANRRFNSEHDTLATMTDRRQGEIEACSQHLFDKLLATIPVRELGEFPGIGPATVDRLKSAGFTNVAILQTSRIHVHGLGEKRLDDIHTAVKRIIGRMRKQFEAGACPQAQELKSKLQEIEGKYSDMNRRTKARVNVIKEVLCQLEEPVAFARQVTFWNYFWKDNHIVVPPELLECSIPDVDQALEEMKGIRHRTESAKKERSQVQIRRTLEVPEVLPATEVIPTIAPDAKRASNQSRSIPSAREYQTPSTSSKQQPPSSSIHAAKGPVLKQPPPPEPNIDPALQLIEASIEFTYAVARSDGTLSAKEESLIQEQMRRRFSYDSALYNRTKAWCAHYESASIDIDACLQRIKKLATPAHQEKLLQFASDLAQASGKLNRRSTKLMERSAKAWGISWQNPQTTPPAISTQIQASSPPAPQPSSSEAEKLKSNAVASTMDPRGILEIDPKTTPTADLVRRQFRLLIARYTPEKVESLGSEFVAMAKARREAIRAAAEELLAPMKEPLELPEVSPALADLRHNPDLDSMFGG